MSTSMVPVLGRQKRRMVHVRRKRLFIGMIAAIFCVLAAMTPWGARTATIIRFQAVELSADDFYDKYDTDVKRFYVRNPKNDSHPEANALLDLVGKKIGGTSERSSYDLGEQCFDADRFYEYQFGPVRYHFVFRSTDYRIWRAYIDSVRSSGGMGTGMVVNQVKHKMLARAG